MLDIKPANKIVPIIFALVSLFSWHGVFGLECREHQTTLETGIDGRSFLVDGLGYNSKSENFAYKLTAQGQTSSAVVFHKAKGKVYRGIGKITFSPDGQHIAYSVWKLDKETDCIVWDGMEGKGYERVEEPIFRNDSQVLSYAAFDKGEFFVVEGTKEGKRYQSVSRLYYSSGTLSYEAFTLGEHYPQNYLVVGNSEMSICTACIISSSGEVIAQIVDHNQEPNQPYSVLFRGNESKRYAEVADLKVSPDHQHLAYTADSGEQHFAVIDGKESNRKYDPLDEGEGPEVAAANYTFSSDSQHLAYLETAGGLVQIVVDDQVMPTRVEWGVNIIPLMKFSPDGHLLVFQNVFRNKNEYMTVIFARTGSGKYSECYVSAVLTSDIEFKESNSPVFLRYVEDSSHAGRIERVLLDCE